MRIAAVVLALALVSPALAQTAPAPAPPPEGTPSAKTQDQLKSTGDYTLPMQPRGRYSYAPVDEGFLRFDHKDGEVALCKPIDGGWTCDPVPDKTVATRQGEQGETGKELTALRDEIARLRQEVASLRPPPPPPPPHPVPPNTVPPSDATGSITLKQDIARARGFIKDTWHRLVDMIDTMRRDIIRKGDDSDLSRT
jgi:hypothetical protein